MGNNSRLDYIKISSDYESTVDEMITGYIDSLINNAGDQYSNLHPDTSILQISTSEIYKEIPEFKTFIDAKNYERKTNNCNEIGDDELESLFEDFKDTVKEWCKGLEVPNEINIKKTIERKLKKMYYINRILAEKVDEAKQSLEYGHVEKSQLSEFNQNCLWDDTPLNMEIIQAIAEDFRIFIIEPCYDKLMKDRQLDQMTEEEIIKSIELQIPIKIEEGIRLI